MERLNGKVALITGAGKGIGKVIEIFTQNKELRFLVQIIYKLYNTSNID